MKVAVINFSGNVGKSTIARHLLAPLIPDSQVIAVESINADDGPQKTIRGKQFSELQAYLQTPASVVVDVGASNVEDFLALMRRYSGSHADFDYFVVPTMPPRKQQQDTAATLAELARMGIGPERIRLVFNQVPNDEPIERVFDTLLAFCAASGAVVPRADACLYFNEIYAMIRGTDQVLGELAADPTDYKSAILATSSRAEQIDLARRLSAQRLARGVVPQIESCFRALALDGLPQGSPMLQEQAT